MPPGRIRFMALACALLAGTTACAQVGGWSGGPCAKPAEVTREHLLGLWRAQFEGLPQGATLLLEPHANYAESFAGTINRNGERRPVVGDIEDGDFTLEESADGVRIAATWLGDVVEGSCGREIRGTWQATGEAAARRFVLTKM